MLEIYLREQFGSLRTRNDGVLLDKDGLPVNGRYEYIDELSDHMNIVATVFSKENDNYTGVLTTITNSKGKRAIGTQLDPKGPAYEAISNGKTYLGEADILGQQYMTQYTPIFDHNQQIIGIYFSGVPIEAINEIFNSGVISTIKLVIIITVCIILVAAVLTYFVATSIAKPIQKVTAAAEQIAQGHFDVTLAIHSKDEIGHLATAFNLTIAQLVQYQAYIDEISEALLSVSKGDLTIEPKNEYAGQFKKLKDHMQALLDNLNSILVQINQSANQVDYGSQHVANASQALSQGATEQARSIEELSASIEEVTTQIKQNAEHARVAREKAGFAGKELQNSNVQMKEMIFAMDEITRKSTEISKIIKIIDDIAFQTNILALNAAVEAARAGTDGKGFSVVADEVRNLAAKSAEAAKNTTILIDETIAAVENGSKIADETANSLNMSAEVALESVSIIDKIADASHEQINQGVEQVSSVVQTNATTAEESAAASEELSAQSNLLKELIINLKLR